ncbi:hypothetical protein JZ751_014616 [Albula glossodonta]|uniref:Small ribosomal subunit protein eS21 n=1 Tax=Albula glossodonta TaxID=121402 RepID=A0A8T2N3V7_9TELE|nr:hypothetical protein JZ751_014616 [Albula glossodonta]
MASSKNRPSRRREEREGGPREAFKMQNDAGEFVDFSASNRIIGAKDHASIQINIAEVDKVTGRFNGQFKTYAICGAIRRMGEADDSLLRLAKNDSIALNFKAGEGQYCDTCTMGDSNRAHPITNAIDGTERWWQSPPLSRSVEYNQVNVTLDLGQHCIKPWQILSFVKEMKEGRRERERERGKKMVQEGKRKE